MWRVATVLGGWYFVPDRALHRAQRAVRPDRPAAPARGRRRGRDRRDAARGRRRVPGRGLLGSTAILNTLLGLLNERVFRRGRTAMPVGLRVCVGASNSLPDDPALAAFADRFLGRVFIDSVADARLEELLEVGR